MKVKPSQLLTIVIALIIALYCGTLVAVAQNTSPSSPTQVEDKIDELIAELLENYVADNEDIAVDYQGFVETLLQYYQQPLNLNQASEIDFADLFFLSPQQVQSILNYRQQRNGFTSIYELQGISGINSETAQMIANFVELPADNITGTAADSKTIPLSRLIKYGKHQIFSRYEQVLEEQKAYLPRMVGEDSIAPPKFEGSQARLYARYKFSSRNRLDWGVTAEKDPGEAFFNGNQKQGFDFYSAHFQLSNQGKFQQILLGDYEVRMGQGLVTWSGIGLRKTSDIRNVSRQERVLKPYTSVNENQFFRGVATTVKLGKIRATGFVSRNNIDGNLQTADTVIQVIEEADFTNVSSIQNTGLHRTEGEILDKDAITRFDTGGQINYRNQNLSVSINGLYTSLSKPLIVETTPDRLFRFSGTSLWNVSADYRYVQNSFTLFGETALSHTGAVASINGLLWNVDKRLSLSVVQRSYDVDYTALSANAFAETSNAAITSAPSNEKGIFTGVALGISPKWEVQAYYDLYRHPWLRSRTDAPSYGNDQIVELQHEVNRRVKMYWRFKNERKQINTDDPTASMDYLVWEQLLRLRYNISYQANRNLKGQSRLEVSQYRTEGAVRQNGYTLLQDVSWQANNLPLNLKLRYALFDTQSYDARIYAYENDVLYAFTTLAYAGVGSRFYAVARYDVSRRLTFWLRYAQSGFTDRQIISEGSDNEIQGSQRSAVKVMMRLKL
ncbi:MAG: ComEA family DNA-binding protein [Chitinophagales bacterium]